ncbi:hypothetical protein [Leptotrichia massiliensis]
MIDEIWLKLKKIWLESKLKIFFDFINAILEKPLIKLILIPLVFIIIGYCINDFKSKTEYNKNLKGKINEISSKISNGKKWMVEIDFDLVYLIKNIDDDDNFKKNKSILKNRNKIISIRNLIMENEQNLIKVEKENIELDKKLLILKNEIRKKQEFISNENLRLNNQKKIIKLEKYKIEFEKNKAKYIKKLIDEITLFYKQKNSLEERKKNLSDEFRKISNKNVENKSNIKNELESLKKEIE